MLASLFLTPSRIERTIFRDSRILLLTWRGKLISDLVASGLSNEPEVSSLLRQERGDLFIDVGANLGYYTRLLSPNFKRIVAVEMDPVICSYLSKGRPKNCRVLCAAVGNRNGYAGLQRYANNLGGAQIVTLPESPFDRVREITLTNLLSNEAHIDLVKVDVQGAEWLVLEGAEPIMHKIGTWVIELHDLGRKMELASHMGRFGYECKWLDSKATDTDHGFFSR